jgi:hypothetical protein
MDNLQENLTKIVNKLSIAYPRILNDELNMHLWFEMFGNADELSLWKAYHAFIEEQETITDSDNPRTVFKRYYDRFKPVKYFNSYENVTKIETPVIKKMFLRENDENLKPIPKDNQFEKETRALILYNHDRTWGKLRTKNETKMVISGYKSGSIGFDKYKKEYIALIEKADELDIHEIQLPEMEEMKSNMKIDWRNIK